MKTIDILAITYGLGLFRCQGVCSYRTVLMPLCNVDIGVCLRLHVAGCGCVLIACVMLLCHVN